MTEENNKVEETTEETQETTVEETEEVENEEESTEGDEDIHKQELVRLKKDNDDKDKKIADLSYKVRENKREEVKEETQDTSNFVTKEDLAKHEQRIFQTQIDSEINNVSDSDSEKELIKYHLENSVRPSGNIKDDVESAKLLANKRKIFQENIMAKREVISNQSKGSGSNSGQKKDIKNEPKLSDADMKMIKMANMKFNSETGRYEGKFTFFDPKSGKSGKLG